PAAANARMLAIRSALPVSTVIARSTGPAIARQLCPAASPYRLPLGPAPRRLRPAPRLPRIASVRRAPAPSRAVHAADTAEGGGRDVQQRAARVARIDDCAAEKVCRRARHCEQRRRDKAAGGGFRDADGLAALLQRRAKPVSNRQQILNGSALLLIDDSALC